MTQTRHLVSAEASGGRILGFLRRRAVEVMTVLYLVTIVYNSLVPLDFSRTAPAADESHGSILGLAVVGISIPDAASNVGFYVPLGVLLCAALVKAGWGKWLPIVPTVLFAAGLSYLMELAQTWSQTRISSAFDCAYNIAGAAGGAAISRVLVLAAGHSARKFTRELRDRPSLVLTGALGLALVIVALVPLDVTFSVNRLRCAVRNACLVPFEKLDLVAGNVSTTEPTEPPLPYGRVSDAGQFAAWEGETTDFVSRHIVMRNWWMLVLDYVTWVVLYAVLALVACYYLRTHCRMDAFRAAVHALGLCAMYSVTSSTLQFFVISRGLDVTVPIFQMGGALVGTFFQPMVLSRVPMLQPSSHPNRSITVASRFWPLEPEQVKPLVVLGLVVVTVGIALRETAPFRFETSPHSIADQIKRIDWLPMEAYQTARFHVAVDDVARKLLRFAVLGGLIVAAGSLRRVPVRAHRPWRIGAWVALAIGGFEAIQVLLPSRVPGVTDVLLAWFGTTAGVYVFQLGRLWWYETRQVSVEETGLRIDYRVELGEPREEPVPHEQTPQIDRPKE